MKKIAIPALLAATLLSPHAFADRFDDDGDYRRHRHHPHARHVVVHHVYDEPRVVYEQPRVVYRERVEYRDRPVYVESAPRDYEGPGRYSAPAPAGVSDRFAGQMVGAVAGGVLGNQVGKGSGRVVATAAGAVIGSIVGGNMASR